MRIARLAGGAPLDIFVDPDARLLAAGEEHLKLRGSVVRALGPEDTAVAAVTRRDVPGP